MMSKRLENNRFKAGRHQKWENGAQNEPNGTQSEPKGAKSVPKDAERGSKGREKGAKGSQRSQEEGKRESKGRPKCIQQATFGKVREKGARRVIRNPIPQTILEPVWWHFALKIDERINAKVDARKIVKIDEKSMRKGYHNLLEKSYVSICRVAKKWVSRERCTHGNHYIHAVEYVSGRVRREMRESKKDVNLEKDHSPK